MKKFMIRAVSLALMLAMVLSVPVVAQADNINLGVKVTSGEDTITVEVDDTTETNKVLEAQKPTLTVPCSFSNAYVEYGGTVIPSELTDGNISFTVSAGGSYTVSKNTIVEVEEEELIRQSEVWIDGEAQSVGVDGKIKLPKDTAVKAGSILVTYDYNEEATADRHTQYPVGMEVWVLERDEMGYLAPVRVPDLDDILGYCGTSIRITGKRGIRMITSVEQSKKAALISAGLADYKLLEYGTAVCWSDDLAGGKPMTLGQSYVESNYAYKRGVADPVFKLDGEQMQYTNVLVGFSMDECKDDIAMRPYMILEDPEGEQVTIYGGIIHRSIGYIAYRNRDVFTPGSAAYEYVWNIIHEVYGDQYDAEYEKG